MTIPFSRLHIHTIYLFGLFLCHWARVLSYYNFAQSDIFWHKLGVQPQPNEIMILYSGGSAQKRIVVLGLELDQQGCWAMSAPNKTSGYIPYPSVPFGKLARFKTIIPKITWATSLWMGLVLMDITSPWVVLAVEVDWCINTKAVWCIIFHLSS